MLFGSTGVYARQEYRGNPDYVVTSFELEDGLPQSTVNDILQTRDGYLWIATHGGLVRFDGISFRVFDRFNTPGLISDRIITLFEDSQGILWIGAESGGLIRKSGNNFHTVDLGDGMSQWNIVTIDEDRDGSYWIGTSGGGLIRLNGEKIEIFTVEDGLDRNIIAQAYTGIDGTVYAVTGYGISAFDGERFLPLLNNKNSELDLFHFIYEDSRGDIWIGTRGDGIYRVTGGDLKALTDYEQRLSGTFVSDIYEDDEGTVWLGTDTGLVRFRDGGFRTLNEDHGLSESNVLSVIRDHEGTVWAGTRVGGLNKLVAANITVYRNETDGAVHNITSISPSSRGRFWFGMNCGGIGLMAHNDVIRQVDLPLENTCVWSVLEDSNGILWIGTWGGGLHRWQNGRMDRFSIAEGYPSNVFLSIFEDSRGRIWTASPFTGVMRYETGSFTYFSVDDGLPHNNVQTFYEDRNGDIWLGTFNGPVKYSDGNFVTFDDSTGITRYPVRAIYQDREGILWFGTYGGLLRFEDGQFKNITTKNGLQDNLISHILEDDYGNFWMGSNRGIQSVSRKELNAWAHGDNRRLTSHFFGTEHGMVSSETNGGFQPSAYRSDDGRLWFPTIEGIAMIDPSRIGINKTPPPVVIEEITAGEYHSLSDDIISVPPNTRSISVRFTALSFISPEKVKFRTMLEGFDDRWNQIGNRREEFYTNIPPGEYRFRVIASNPGGYWNTEGGAVNIRVLPAFWQTPWFRLVAFFLLISGFAVMVFYASRRKLKRRLVWMEKQHIVERERLRIAQDLHDELGSRLTEIQLLGELGHRMDTTPDKLRTRMQTISGACQDVIHTFREIIWSIHPQHDSLDKFIDNLTLFSRDYFSRADIRCRFDIPIEIPEYELASDIRHHLLMVYKELCNNIVKHAGATEVHTEVECTETMCEIVLRDDGKGFETNDTAGEGIGLSNIRKRLKSTGGSINIESEPGTGTTATLCFPVQASKNHTQ